MVQPLWKTVQRFFKKLNIEIPFDSAIPLLAKRIESGYSNKYLYTNIQSSTIRNSQKVEMTQMFNCQMDKQNGVYPYDDIIRP